MTKQSQWDIQEPMQAKILEKNEAVLAAQSQLQEMLDLARALAGAPDNAIVGDVRMGFVLPPNENGGK